MSWHFSRALVEEFLAATSSDGTPFAPSNGSPTPRLYLQPDRMTAFSRISRSGMTCAPLTDGHGAALLTWFLADSRARTSAPPAPAQASTARAQASGVKWPESSARYDPATSSWRTHRCLWDEALPWSSVTLPRWGMTRSGLVLRHPTLERPISGTASGLWQTPVADDAVNRSAGKWNSRGEPKLSAQVMVWPTPTAQDSRQAGGKGCIARGKRGLSLHQATQLWPTPVRRDYRSPGRSCLDRTGGKQGENLPQSVGGQLNPDWVEWLMGWPIGWTDLNPLGTARFREWLQQHSPSCTTSEEDAA